MQQFGHRRNTVPIDWKGSKHGTPCSTRKRGKADNPPAQGFM